MNQKMNKLTPEHKVMLRFAYLGAARVPYYVIRVGDMTDLIEVGKSHALPNGFRFGVIVTLTDGKKTMLETRCERDKKGRTKMTVRCLNGHGPKMSCTHTPGAEDGKYLSTIFREASRGFDKHAGRKSITSRMMMNHPEFYDMLYEATKSEYEQVCPVEWTDGKRTTVKWPRDKVYRRLLL